MENDQNVQDLRKRQAPIEIAPEEFRRLGYQLVDRIADFLSSLPQRPVTPGESVAAVRQALGIGEQAPRSRSNPQALLEQAASLVFDHSLFNSHPRFWGYVTSPAAPIGIPRRFARQRGSTRTLAPGHWRQWRPRLKLNRSVGLRS
jgi:hypothetical protein